jgi:hypothetical protein
MSDVVGRIERREFVSDQELFDYIVGKVIVQGEPSIHGDVCRYRAPDGLKCAVGHIIPDSLYRKDMEGTTLTKIVDKTLGLTCYAMLRDLQVAHDNAGDVHIHMGNADFIADFTNRAKDVAHIYGLKFNHGGETK